MTNVGLPEQNSCILHNLKPRITQDSKHFFLLRYNNLKQSQYVPRAMQTHSKRATSVTPRGFATRETIRNAAQLFEVKKKRVVSNC